MARKGGEITGFEELARNLRKLDAATNVRVVRQSASAAVTPAMRRIRAAAPEGSKAHRTYKGRLVAPGFTKRNVKKRSMVDKATGLVTVKIGVAKEAFYALFYDVGFTRRGGAPVAATRWLSGTFSESMDEIVARYKAGIADRVSKIRATGK